MQSGRVLTHPALARQRFREIAARPEPLLDLVEASLVISLEDNPRLDIDRYLQQVGLWRGGVRLAVYDLRSSPRKEILSRELAQLKAAYLAQHDLQRAAASVDRLLIRDERDPFEIRDSAAIAMQMHAYTQAIDFFERYLEL